MTIILTERRGMHRHSDETVAAVVLAAVTELRRRLAHDPVGSAWERAEPGLRARTTESVRVTRSGQLPRARYEAASGPHDPPYTELPVSVRDEDQLLWLVTQALTGE